MQDEILQFGQNTGVRLDPLSPMDWIQGAESGATRTVLIPNGQYDAVLPDDETQAIYALDVLGCVTFSGLNNIETIFTYKLANNLFSQRQKDFLTNEEYIDPATGKVNFSDRFTAKMSGTNMQGNSLEAVSDSMRKLHGLVPQKDWPTPPEMGVETDPLKKWDIYYATVPDSVKEKGLRFLEVFLIDREWVVIFGLTKDPIAAVKTALQYGPLQIAAAVCSPWGSNEGLAPIQGCGCTTQHATTIYGYQDLEYFKDFDHYKSYRKKLAWNYCLPYVMQFHVSEKLPPAPSAPFTHVFIMQIHYGQDNPEVRNLQKALQTVLNKDGKPYMKPGVFGPFGPQTKMALGAFQTDHGINDPDGQGTNFGPRSRAAINKQLNK